MLFAALFSQGRFEDAREALAAPKPATGPVAAPATDGEGTPPPAERTIPCLGLSLVEADEAENASVAKVGEHSPASSAGVLAGDAIVQFGTRQIRSGADLVAEIAAARPGEGFSAVVRRDGAHLSLRGVVGAKAEEETTCTEFGGA
jgi:S1-C subfamily serine protease